MTEYDLEKIHRYSRHNRTALSLADHCGCFHCVRSFSPFDVREYVEGGNTALCPHCGVDAVLGDAAGLPVSDDDFLWAMHDRWFEGNATAEDREEHEGEVELGEMILNLVFGAYCEGFGEGAEGKASLAAAQLEWRDSMARETTLRFVRQLRDRPTIIQFPGPKAR